jgi:cation/acetate symporter
VLAAIAAHGRRPVDYYIADRSIRPAVGGMTAAAGVAGLLVIGIAGGAFTTAAEFVVSAAGFLLGLLVLGFLFAPGLQRFRGFSVAEFMAARFGGTPARLAAAAVAFASSFLLLVAHVETSGPLLSMLLNLAPEQGVYVATGLTLCAVLPGGMRSLTWTQMVQYFLIAAACLLPAGFLSAFPDGSEAGGAPALDSLLPAADRAITGRRVGRRSGCPSSSWLPGLRRCRRFWPVRPRHRPTPRRAPP